MIDYKACIFDLDGTVLDSMGVWRKVDEAFLGKRGLPLSDEYCKAISHMKLDGAAEYTIRLFGLEEKAENIIKEWLDLAREEFTYHIQPKPYAVEYLKKLKELGFPIAVATTSQRELYVPALKRIEIYDLFDGIADSELLGCSKDRPDIFLAAAKMLNTEPKDTLVFEDTVHALHSASKAGFVTVGFLDNAQSKNHDEIRKIARLIACDFKEFYEDLCDRTAV